MTQWLVKKGNFVYGPYRTREAAQASCDTKTIYGDRIGDEVIEAPRELMLCIGDRVKMYEFVEDGKVIAPAEYATVEGPDYKLGFFPEEDWYEIYVVSVEGLKDGDDGIRSGVTIDHIECIFSAN